MALDVITSIITPAETYDLTSLVNVKLDLGLNAGITLTTNADTPSGQVLPFLATSGVVVKQSASGLNIAAGTIVSLVGASSITLSAVIDGDIPSGTQIVFGADTAGDAFLTRAITLSSTAIQTYCNRQFAVETIQDVFNFLEDYNDRQNNNKLTRLQLTKGPLISVSSVTVLENEIEVTLVEGTHYIVDESRSQLIRISANTGRPIKWWAVQTTVEYQAGFATIPSDIDDACSRMVKKAFWARGRDPSIMEQSQGNLGNTKYWVTASPDGNLPPEICDLLDKYRDPVIA